MTQFSNQLCPLPAGPVSGAPSEVVQPSDGRASLLESIRNAGGIGKAKLRNVKERKMEKKKQKEQEQGALDLYVDSVQLKSYLHAPLMWGSHVKHFQTIATWSMFLKKWLVNCWTLFKF